MRESVLFACVSSSESVSKKKASDYKVCFDDAMDDYQLFMSSILYTVSVANNSSTEHTINQWCIHVVQICSAI